MSDLDSIVGKEKVFRTVREYRIGVTSVILVPCGVGVLNALGEYAHLDVAVSSDTLQWGAIAIGGAVMGHFTTRRAIEVLKEQEIPARLHEPAAVLAGLLAAGAYSAFGWVANQLGYWDARFFTSLL